MSKYYEIKIPFIYTSILYIAGLLLFLEWLYPIEQVTDTAYIGIFIIYTIFCFFISLLQVRWWLSLILKGFGVLFALNGIYSEYSMLSIQWYKELYADLIFNVEAMLAGQWFDLSNLFRTLLFLIIIWLMSYLIFYWFVQVKRVMVFSILTFIFITLLDTFTVYNAEWAIIRIFVIVFLALGISNIIKEVQLEHIQTYRLRARPVWVIPLIVMTVFSSIVGYAAPKFEPQWPDPVPYIESAVSGNGLGGGTVQKVGYGEDDTKLGGSFVQDYTPVFQAYMKEDNYFRVESKDYYTGKGWMNSEQKEFVPQLDGNITFKTFHSTVETEKMDVTLELDERAKLPKIIYPYGIRHVQVPSADITLSLYDQTGEIKTEVNERDVYLTNYTISYDSPSYPIDEMRKSGPTQNEELQKKYTQLPATLPTRVRELAVGITEDYQSQYDKVRAIERYFSSNGFVYQTSDVAVPGVDQDYVDQFLFDTKAGYCDNFSTSMVILLRAIDIPARWVKGFTSGEKIEDNINNEGYDLYQVTNANAHSWVEVYFEGVGWVPFEPTQGFNVPNDYTVNTTTADHNDELEAPEVTPEMPEIDQELPEEDAAEAFNPSKGEASKLNNSYVPIAVVLLVVLVIIGLLYWKRFQIQTFFINWKLQRNPDAATFQEAYLYLLKLLKSEGFQKEPDQTLREFATRIDNWYGTDEMGQLTSTYERLIYQKTNTKSSNDELSYLWKKLVKRILG